MPEPDVGIRLNKYLALHARISRRGADELIASKLVTINDEVASIGARVMPNDLVKVRGALVQTESYRYITFHKPTGYVCSRKRQGDNPTIYELLPAELHALKPVGRLDKDSSGLILLTNDGDFAQRMTHPSYKKLKRYEVSLDRELEPLHQQMISDYGVELPDGFSKLTLTRLVDDSRRDWIVEMSEGRNRQIRRTFAALGYGVTKLHRTLFGSYVLAELSPGQFTEVSST